MDFKNGMKNIKTAAHKGMRMVIGNLKLNSFVEKN